ncbi:OmpA family protein [Flavobacterium ovatum]|uniref:OmpA family protein n=1 Tax=Flavobacterium ovatum TaxID=1928857 RepID=UPI003450E608
MAFNLNKSEESKGKFDLSKNNIEAAGTYSEPIIEKPGKSKKWLFVLAGLILIGGASGYFLLASKDSKNITNEATSISPIKSFPDEEGLSNATGEVKDSSKGSNESIPSDDNLRNRNSEAKSPSNNAKTVLPQTNETSAIGANSNSGNSSNDLPYKNGEYYNIYQFPFGVANYTSSNVELDNLVNVLRKNPELKISIIAYTDNIGDAIVNQKLSVKRAKAIFNYIVSKGIIAEKVSYEGKGISTKYATQGENRRAEFIIRG